MGTDADATRWRLVGDCRAGLWTDPADKSKVDVDGLPMVVTPVAAGGIHFKLAGRIAPGPIGPIVRYAPLRNVPLDPAARLAALRSALVLAGEPPEVLPGNTGVGDPFLTAPVKHGLTGHLLVRVFPRFGVLWPKGTEMPVGQAVFGVPSYAGPGDGIAWCAAARKANGWETTCLEPESDSYMQMVQTDLGYFWSAKLRLPLAPNRFALSMAGEGDPASTDPVVAPGPIDEGPPMTATLKLAGAKPKSKTDPTLVYYIDVDLDWGEGAQRLNQVSYELPPEGKAIRVLGQVLLLKPGSDDTHMAVSEPATPPASVTEVELLPTSDTAP